MIVCAFARGSGRCAGSAPSDARHDGGVRRGALQERMGVLPRPDHSAMIEMSAREACIPRPRRQTRSAVMRVATRLEEALEESPDISSTGNYKGYLGPDDRADPGPACVVS